MQMRTMTPGNIFHQPGFGYSVYGETLGETWINAVTCVLLNGESEPDESRGRIALQNFRLKSETQDISDQIFSSYAKKENIEAMIDLVFNSDTMKDCDITPSFRNGSKSYKKRIEENSMIDFIVGRLKLIPESKKAVMVFPDKNDYIQVANNPFNDYFPCIISIQLRLRPPENGIQKLNTIVNMRSWNIDQKGAGDLTIFSMLTKQVCERLTNEGNMQIKPGSIDISVTDIHIYDNTITLAENIVKQYKTSSI